MNPKRRALAKTAKVVLQATPRLPVRFSVGSTSGRPWRACSIAEAADLLETPPSLAGVSVSPCWLILVRFPRDESRQARQTSCKKREDGYDISYQSLAELSRSADGGLAQG